MTASDAHGISADFQWKDEYQSTLDSIANTDEVDPDLDWPPLKDAIKYKITSALAQFPASPSPILHPAAVLIPLMQQSSDGAFLAETSYTTSSSAESLASLPLNDSTPTGSIDSATSAAIVASSASESLSNRFAPEGSTPQQHPDAYALAHGVSPAEAQGFFASKSQPPASMSSSWGRRLTDDEFEREKALVFGMLDEFDTQPPFTIQRLAELAVRPMELQKTRAKYLHALQRVLSVTATRDAFPIDHSSPIQTASDGATTMPAAIPAPTGPIDEVSQHHRANGSFSAAGMGTVRPRSHSTCSSNSSSSSLTASARSQAAVDRHIEPLFSPIPFLIRDAGEDGGSGVEAAVKEALEEVPDLELGGADRTHLQLVGETFTEGVTPIATASETSTSPTSSPAKPNTAPTPPLAQTSSPTPPSASAAPGIPPGRIDELDQPNSTSEEPRKMETSITPISSTTHLPEQKQEQQREVKRSRHVPQQQDVKDVEMLDTEAEAAERSDKA